MFNSFCNCWYCRLQFAVVDIDLLNLWILILSISHEWTCVMCKWSSYVTQSKESIREAPKPNEWQYGTNTSLPSRESRPVGRRDAFKNHACYIFSRINIYLYFCILNILHLGSIGQTIWWLKWDDLIADRINVFPFRLIIYTTCMGK